MNPQGEKEEKEAIEAAVAGNWLKAIELNTAILKKNPKDVGTLNRLAKAYWQSNRLDDARAVYQKVIRVDRYNPIATKAIQRLNTAKKSNICAKNKTGKSLVNFFLREPGKTKSVRLVNTARAELLCSLGNVECLKLVPKKYSVTVARENGDYLGSLPDDLSRRLLFLLKGGNRYEVCAKTVERQGLEVFIRETFRSKKFKNLPSFVHPAG
ncbi:MAG: tetratricopeptide repeat protein [Candidatus Shapirobacteria bacterium]